MLIISGFISPICFWYIDYFLITYLGSKQKIYIPDAHCTINELDLQTPDEYTYTYLEDKGLCAAKQGRLQFWVKASNDVHINLADTKDNDNTIEIVIGGWGNSKSVIRFARRGVNKKEASGSRLSVDEYRPFWITWTGGEVKVGAGTEIGANVFLKAKSSQEVNHVGVATAFGSGGNWAFGKGMLNCGIFK